MIRHAGRPPHRLYQERLRRIEEETRALAQRRGELVHRRSALVTELDDCRARLAVLEETDGPGNLVRVGSSEDVAWDAVAFQGFGRSCRAGFGACGEAAAFEAGSGLRRAENAFCAWLLPFPY